MLRIEKTEAGETLTLALGGRLEMDDAPALEAELMPACKTAKELALDLRDLEYISSAGVRALLMAQRQISGRGRMRLIHVGPAVMDILETRGLTEIFSVSENEE